MTNLKPYFYFTVVVLITCNEILSRVITLQIKYNILYKVFFILRVGSRLS